MGSTSVPDGPFSSPGTNGCLKQRVAKEMVTSLTSSCASPKKADSIKAICPEENERLRKFTPWCDEWDGKYEFGGPLCCLFIIIFSHTVLYYFWICVEFYEGCLVYPGHAALDGRSFLPTMLNHIASHALTSPKMFALFSGFQIFQYLLNIILPGPVTYGLAIPSENGYHLPYKCNAVYAWYVILVCLAAVHFSGMYPLYRIREHFGELMTAAIIWGDTVAFACYVSGFVCKNKLRMSGNVIYDFFMGSVLNPRLPGGVDLKLWAEIRNSWVLLFVLTASCASKLYKETGKLSPGMCFIVLAQLLYVNACQKGEECVPTTWDIYYEKDGWMLIFWNFAGVPFLYCFQPLFLQTVKPAPYSIFVWILLFPALLFCYYVFDTVNSQKNRFRMVRQGVPDKIVHRKAFPQLPWAFIPNPRTIRSEDGSLELFVDGWYRYARKMHYSADISMSLMWGLSCGTHHFIPYFYFCFFFTHLVHRITRDEARCKRKYGKLWDQYIQMVPYRFVPGIW